MIDIRMIYDLCKYFILIMLSCCIYK